MQSAQRRLSGLVALAVLVAGACSATGEQQQAKRPPKIARPAPRPAGPPPGSPAPVAPLTGLPTTAPGRPALSVEINHTNVPVTTGLDYADVVYEYVVEGGITRLVAVFDSQIPDRIGPIRSVRPTEASIVWPLGGVFAYSGGAQYALDSIRSAPVVRVQASNAGRAMFRDPHGQPPNNLYGHGPQLLAKVHRTNAPLQLFAYRKPAAGFTGRAVASFVVGFRAGYAVTWDWDHRRSIWTRAVFGRVERSTDGIQLQAKNVVVLFVQYAKGVGVMGAHATLIGRGTAWVFSSGKLATGQWSRSSNARPEQLRDTKGATIRISPGPTWVELVPVGYPVTLAR